MNNESNKTPSFGEISVIRDILMGQQMSEYDHRFDAINTRAANLEKDYNEKIEQLRQDTSARLDALQQEMNARFDRLEKMLLDHVEQLNQQLSQVSKSDKAQLGTMLSEISQRLLKGE